MSDLQVVLFEPEIPPNTGAIARLCLATGSTLHLVGRLGFRIDDRQLKRAGLDYFQHADVRRHDDLACCLTELAGRRVFYFSAHARQTFTQAAFHPDSVLVFGSETKGLPASVLADAANCWTLPMLDDRVRSLNVAQTVGIVVYEALRQTGALG